MQPGPDDYPGGRLVRRNRRVRGEYSFSMILLEVDPNVVKPGWTPLVITLLLLGAMVFLYLSMRKQFRKIRTSEDAESDNDESDNAEDSASERPPSNQG
jgi:hypothetical protein